MNSESSTTASAETTQDHPDRPVPRTASEDVNTRDSVGQAATGKTEVHGPFLKSKRRARREFSDTDDKNLLKGFQRYGPVWHLMRDDFELGFGMRHPTDLRDRFRIRYPDLFAQAGFKLKPKEERALADRANGMEKQEAQASRQPTTVVGKTLDRSDKLVARTVATTTPKTPSVTTHVQATTTSQPDSMRPTFDLITDLTFDDDDGDRSPIVLNRNILQWADENSSSVPAATAPPPHTPSDLLYNPFTASDGLHINPLATLKLPSTTHWSYTNPAPPPSLPPPGPLKHALPAHTDHTAVLSRAPNSTANGTCAAAAATSSVASRSMPDMRTPNLPNIVFPYVPNASARGAVHNLPPPADILSERLMGADGYVWIG